GSPGYGAAPCGLTTGSRPLWPGRGRCLRPQAPPLQAPTMPAGDRACWRLPLQGALAVAGHPCKGPSHGQLPLSSLRLLQKQSKKV
ncbi:hypothetical protein BHE74_00032690, partial [Ensete ventricosum]